MRWAWSPMCRQFGYPPRVDLVRTRSGFKMLTWTLAPTSFDITVHTCVWRLVFRVKSFVSAVRPLTQLSCFPRCLGLFSCLVCLCRCFVVEPTRQHQLAEIMCRAVQSGKDRHNKVEGLLEPEEHACRDTDFTEAFLSLDGAQKKRGLHRKWTAQKSGTNVEALS